jgi:GntR family transcriptional regulator, transcriptional repressor for pyruvate dehydrogenase complex
MGKRMFEPLKRRKKAYEEVADKIRERILQNEVELNDRLPSERDMAEQFGVSRVAVREAVRVLELTGFVIVRKGVKGGIFVAQEYDRPLIEAIRHMASAGEVDIDDLFTVRLLIEPFAAASVARDGSSDDIARLGETVRMAEEASRKGEIVRPLNFRFHRQIVQMSGNAILSAVGETTLTLLTEFLHDVPSTEISRQHLAFHSDILAAIKTRDQAASRQLVSADIAMLKESLRNTGRRPGADPP